MCGVLGIVTKNNSKLNFKDIKKYISNLLILSESRGKESSGIAVKKINEEKINILKKPMPATKLIKTKEYSSFFKKNVKNQIHHKTKNNSIAIIGHSRLVTDGARENNENNQPVIKNKTVAVHNGIITNANYLWSKYKSNLKKNYEVDTEILLDILRLNIKKNKSLADATASTFKEIEGSASVAILMEDSNKILLASNTGSLYYYVNKKTGILFFASEEYILSVFIKKTNKKNKGCKIKKIKPFTGIIIDMGKLSIIDFSLKKYNYKKKQTSTDQKEKAYKLSSDYNLELFSKIKRCTKCILPETFPFIEFDEKGVCNYCKNYKKIKIKGRDKLEELLKKHRSKDGKADCIVTFSGGRDSSYGLHYIKNVMKMNPLAFTYDWAMVTDLARRNQARICGKLGIEHIIASADIRKKRENIKKNIIAWLKKPELGIIPLFMAGDKQVHHYVKKLEEKTGIKLKIWMDNKLENTDFKSGFAKIEPLFEKKQHDELLQSQKIRLALYYLKNFIANPSYLNSSIIDTIWAYHSQYIKSRKNNCSLYEFIKWDENKILSTLLKEYNWETAEDTKCVWRIGDETAPFYNYIYYTMTGFTENDTFRSNQIRQGLLIREQALELVKEENRPRPDSIDLYFKKINLNMNFKKLKEKLKPYELIIK